MKQTNQQIPSGAMSSSVNSVSDHRPMSEEGMDSIPRVGNLQLPAYNSYKQGEEVKQSTVRIDIEKGSERCDIEEVEVAIASNNIAHVVDAADPPRAVNVLELPNGTRISLKVIVSGTSVKVAGNVVPAPAEADVQIELPDGTKLSSVVRATPAWELIAHNPFPQRKLIKIVISFSSQLAAAFAGGALSSKSQSISISSPSSSSSTLLVSPSRTAVAFTVANLIGFVSVIIALSFENKGPSLLASWPILGRRNLSCLSAKLGLAAVASAVVIAMGAALHLGTKGYIAFTAAACLPTFLALALV